MHSSIDSGLVAFRAYLQILASRQLGPALRRRVDSSDMVQQTLLEACRNWESFRGEDAGARAAWLRKILANVIARTARDLQAAKRDHRREESLEASLHHSSLQLEACLAATDPSPGHQAMRSERLLALCVALEELPEIQREVVLLHYCDGWKVREIAAETGRSAASVAGLLRRGLSGLRQALGERP